MKSITSTGLDNLDDLDCMGTRKVPPRGMFRVFQLFAAFLFFHEADAEIGGLRFCVGKAATLGERVHHEVLAPAATPLALIIAENGKRSRFVRFRKHVRTRVPLCKRRFFR
jgi:hypothetical protein